MCSFRFKYYLTHYPRTSTTFATINLRGQCRHTFLVVKITTSTEKQHHKYTPIKNERKIVYNFDVFSSYFFHHYYVCACGQHCRRISAPCQSQSSIHGRRGTTRLWLLDTISPYRQLDGHRIRMRLRNDGSLSNHKKVLSSYGSLRPHPPASPQQSFNGLLKHTQCGIRLKWISQCLHNDNNNNNKCLLLGTWNCVAKW